MGKNDKIREIIFGDYRIILKFTSPLLIYILTAHLYAKRLRQNSLKGLKENH
jgi:hypothetical protein